MTAAATLPRFKSTRRKGGGVVVHRVPIFVETSKEVGKGDERHVKQFDAAWISAAIGRAQQQEREGYLPPLHVQHHGEGRDVKPAGHFRVLGAEQIQFGGESRMAVMAELHITNPDVAAEVQASRFPYRSVEIHKLDTPSIDSLALLDDQVPHCRLPVLEVDEPAEAAFRSKSVVVFHAGERAEVQFEFGADASADTKPKEPKEGVPDDRKDKSAADDQQGEDASATSPDAKAIVKAIKSGAISVADLQAVIAAIRERGDAGSTESQPGDEASKVADGKKPPASPVPGTQMGAITEDTMTKTDPKPEVTMATKPEDAIAMAALQGKLDVLEAKFAARDAVDKRREAVSGAMKKLAGRATGSGIEDKLTKFHEGCKGTEAEVQAQFNAYVEVWMSAPPSTPNFGGGGAAMVAEALPAIAMKYSAAGTTAVEKAAKLAAEWEVQSQLGLSTTQDRYVEIHMTRAGFKAPAAKATA